MGRTDRSTLRVTKTIHNRMLHLISITYCLFSHAFVVAQVGDSALPVINQRVLEFVNAHMGERVDRGECWDLAAFALNDAGAKWNGKLQYGRLLDPGKEPVLPGDIIQLEGVEFKWHEGDATNVITMPHHTAIVYEVKSSGNYVVAHQNMQGIGRKVGLGTIVLEHRSKGKIMIYRPQLD